MGNRHAKTAKRPTPNGRQTNGKKSSSVYPGPQPQTYLTSVVLEYIRRFHGKTADIQQPSGNRRSDNGLLNPVWQPPIRQPPAKPLWQPTVGIRPGAQRGPHGHHVAVPACSRKNCERTHAKWAPENPQKIQQHLPCTPQELRKVPHQIGTGQTAKNPARSTLGLNRKLMLRRSFSGISDGTAGKWQTCNHPLATAEVLSGPIRFYAVLCGPIPNTTR